MSANRGRFQRGPDPRRHSFTMEERRRGFQHAQSSLVERYGESHGVDRNFACHMLCRQIKRKERKGRAS